MSEWFCSSNSAAAFPKNFSCHFFRGFAVMQSVLYCGIVADSNENTIMQRKKTALRKKSVPFSVTKKTRYC